MAQASTPKSTEEKIKDPNEKLLLIGGITAIVIVGFLIIRRMKK